MKVTKRIGVLAVGAALVLTGCSDDAAPQDDAAPAPAEQQDDDTPDEPSDEAVLVAALQRTAAATQRSFTSVVRVSTPNGVVEVTLAGSRTGEDRTLVVTTDRGTVTYAVTGGEVTVDTGDGPTAVEASAVPSAPSLDALEALEGLTFPAAGQAVGTIDAASVLGGDTPPGVVDVTIDYDPGGFVRGFRMDASDGSFSAVVTFLDVAD